MLFLDRDKPIATCVSATCNDCAVGGKIQCHFRPRDLIHFLLIACPPFLLGGAGIYHASVWWLLPWLLLIVAFFRFIEIRVLCSHCPHYAESPSSLKCWAHYSSPKLWKYRPGPMSRMEKAIMLGGSVIWGYPLPFLLSGPQWFLLIVYAMTTAGFFMTLKVYMCSRCMNLACPLNSVDEATRKAFLECNPDLAQALEP